MLLFQFPLVFHQIQNGVPVPSHGLWLFLCWLGRFSWSFERCSMEDIFKPRASAAASEFWEWVQDGIDVCTPHCKYQFKPHSSPWFSAVFAAAIIHRNHFFRLYQQNKSSESKVKFRKAWNNCKRVLEAAKLVCMYVCIYFAIIKKSKYKNLQYLLKWKKE